jgi:hypothetical protein
MFSVLGQVHVPQHRRGHPDLAGARVDLFPVNSARVASLTFVAVESAASSCLRAMEDGPTTGPARFDQGKPAAGTT